MQPFAGYPEQIPSGVTNASSTAHLSTTPPTNVVTANAPLPPPSSSLSQDKPPPPATTGASGGSSNPYRIGTGFGSRKPAYGTSGIASFSGSTSVAPPTSQLLTQHPQMMVPSQPTQPAPPPQVSMGVGLVPQAPPTSITGGPTPTVYQSVPSAPPPIAGVPTHTGPPTHIVETQLSGGGWDHTSQPVRYHWFYLRSGEKYWIPFSLVDSHRLEQSFVQHPNTSEEVCVQVGRGGGGLCKKRSPCTCSHYMLIILCQFTDIH